MGEPAELIEAQQEQRYDLSLRRVMEDAASGEVVAVFVEAAVAQRAVKLLNARSREELPAYVESEQRIRDLQAEMDRQVRAMERSVARSQDEAANARQSLAESLQELATLRSALRTVTDDVFGTAVPRTYWVKRLGVSGPPGDQTDVAGLGAYVREQIDEVMRLRRKVSCARCGHEADGCPRCGQPGTRLGGQPGGLRYCHDDPSAQSCYARSTAEMGQRAGTAPGQP